MKCGKSLNSQLSLKNSPLSEEGLVLACEGGVDHVLLLIGAHPQNNRGRERVEPGILTLQICVSFPPGATVFPLYVTVLRSEVSEDWFCHLDYINKDEPSVHLQNFEKCVSHTCFKCVKC